MDCVARLKRKVGGTRPRNFRRAFQAMLANHVSPPQPHHELRHWLTSLLLNASARRRVISEAMSHAGIQASGCIRSYLDQCPPDGHGKDRPALAHVPERLPTRPQNTGTVLVLRSGQGPLYNRKLAPSMVGRQEWEPGTPDWTRIPPPGSELPGTICGVLNEPAGERRPSRLGRPIPGSSLKRPQ